MKSKFLFLMSSILFIFLLANVSAVVVYGDWENNQSSIQITLGDDVDFSVDFFTMSPPMTVNVKLYDSGTNLVHSFENNKVVNGNGFAQTYTITGAIYQATGTFELILSSSDSFPSSDSHTLTLTVNPQPNSAPVITSTPVREVNESTAYSYDVNATDADGDVLTYSLTQKPSWLSINSQTGLITGTAPSVTADTNFDVTVSVSDGKGGTATQPYTLTVKNVVPPVNNPPVANNQSVTTTQNTAVTIALTATDADGNTLTYSIVSNPTNGVLSAFNSATGQVTYTPNSGFTGSDSFTFKANDGQADSNTATVSITVNPAGGNSPPIITSTPVIQVNESTAYSYDVDATDADGDVLTYSFSGPSWLSIDANTGLLSGTAPAVNANTQFNVTVVVNDGRGGTATQTYVLTVLNVVPPVNNPPVITSNPITSVNEKATYTYDVNATDADGDTLTYSLSGPSWLSINSSTGLISGTAPSVSADTNFSVTITVSDGQATATQTYTLKVVNIPSVTGRGKTGGGGVKTLPSSELEEQQYLNQFAPITAGEGPVPQITEGPNFLKILLIIFWLIVFVLLVVLAVLLVRRLRK